MSVIGINEYYKIYTCFSFLYFLNLLLLFYFIYNLSDSLVFFYWLIDSNVAVFYTNHTLSFLSPCPPLPYHLCCIFLSISFYFLYYHHYFFLLKYNSSFCHCVVSVILFLFYLHFHIIYFTVVAGFILHSPFSLFTIYSYLFYIFLFPLSFLLLCATGFQSWKEVQQ